MSHPATAGPRVTVDTSQALLVALYLRDRAGLHGAGSPSLPPVVPAVPSLDVHRLITRGGRPAELRVEWEAWWHTLVRSRTEEAVLPLPPEFASLDGMAALTSLVRAHVGVAMEWAEERCAEYALLAGARGSSRTEDLMGRILQEHELELDRPLRAFTLELVELPLGVARAWWVDPDRMLICSSLMDDEHAFRTYVEPVVRMLA